MTTFIIHGKDFEAPALESGLYVVATPIGNLGDITIRALQTLAACDVIACEDTRVTGKLLSRYAITTRRRPYHEHNADKEGLKLIALLREGQSVALVSDAGTPLISDPGQRLVAAALQEGMPVIAIPGASAPLTALSGSGLFAGRFTFAGFLPPKQGARQATLSEFTQTHGTLIFFEGPSRLAATLKDMAAVFGEDHGACVARELTKLHEEFRSAPLAQLAAHYREHPPKGEIVILVKPLVTSAQVDGETVLRELLETMNVSRAAAEAARLTGRPKRELYQLALHVSGAKRGK
ncbi:16S rRNA (cytidine(1402)-2'-O)-methyltransferase [Salaquimonas pukyongi]|uniref:16S rRNA (cytidine(1402)-2'-O)-methyltransferase n=1 Tax=Salaquimonas pukyongi TaxID=2712698 RepID=UPI00096BB193|nr:16S rRNA (cytidine(1402)-2'-O)-methyltransferase [Salaquimonas pukyongi]